MKVALVCKSDTTGGAAVVTFRLMNALRRKGVDARMIVVEKLSDSPWVIKAASARRAKIPFIIERLRIFLKNGFRKDTIFKIDTCTDGLSIYKIPFVKQADVICLNWVNQGMLSTGNIRMLARLGSHLVWTMHDMWNMTGICHHAGYCREYITPDGECGRCPLLKGALARKTLAHHTWIRKREIYSYCRFHFVAVSRWLADCARNSSLMDDAKISVIPNAFPLLMSEMPKPITNKRIIFGAARIDDPIKGHDTLIEATKILAEKFPERAKEMELVTFGSLKNPDALANVGIRHTHLGRISPDEIKDVYQSGSVVVSSSEWETLPGTLIEGQAWGCVPVALDHGGQSDIIDHLATGYLVPWSDDMKKNALGIAEGIIWGFDNHERIMAAMQQSVISKFSEDAVAEAYIRLFNSFD